MANYPQFTQPSNYEQPQPIYSGHPQQTHGQPQQPYPRMQHQPNTQTTYAVNLNQQFDSDKVNKIMELGKSIDEGYYLWFKILLWLKLFGSVFLIIYVVISGYLYTIRSGLVALSTSSFGLSAMKRKSLQNAQHAFVLALFEVIFIILDLIVFYRVLKSDRYLYPDLILFITCVIITAFHSAVFFGIYKVTEILTKRDRLKSELHFPLIQNTA